MSFPCWGIDRRNGFCVDGGPDLLLAACVGFPLLPVIHHNKRRCHCNCHPSHSITIVATTISIMSTQEQPASKVYSMLPKTIGRLTTQQFGKKERVKITEDYRTHKAGEAGKVEESFETGNECVCLYQSNSLERKSTASRNIHITSYSTATSEHTLSHRTFWPRNSLSFCRCAITVGFFSLIKPFLGKRKL